MVFRNFFVDGRIRIRILEAHQPSDLPGPDPEHFVNL